MGADSPAAGAAGGQQRRWCPVPWAVDDKLSAERADSVGQTFQARTGCGRRPTATVVGYRDPQGAVRERRPDRNPVGLRVLVGVGECLGDEIVRGDLDSIGKLERDVHDKVDRQTRAFGERLQRTAEADIGDDCGRAAAPSTSRPLSTSAATSMPSATNVRHAAARKRSSSSTSKTRNDIDPSWRGATRAASVPTRTATGGIAQGGLVSAECVSGRL